jgi:exopolysaccharide biosynthesis predicted pyruvyltransferase EpsI
MPTMSDQAGHPEKALIGRLSTLIRGALDPLLAGEDRVALVDFPNHPNSGDSAIWLGQLRYLEEKGISLAYTCEMRSFSARRLTRALPSGTVLLSGGGNLGDLWPTFEEFRERVVGSLPDHRLIQLPQTIEFASDVALARAATLFSTHGNLTMLVRDSQSLAVATDMFGLSAALAPDMAFALGPLPRPEPQRSVVLLARRDIERIGASSESGSDWPSYASSGLAYPVIRKTSKIAGRIAKHVPTPGSSGWRVLDRTYTMLARERLASAARMVGAGEVLVTDRLHGHIIAMLMGVPHFLVDNSYGKLRRFHETWTADSTITHWADDLASAVEQATSLAGD